MSTIICTTCQSILKSVNPSLPSLQEHKWQIDDLLKSAAESCYICKQIWSILRRERPDLELAASTLLQTDEKADNKRFSHTQNSIGAPEAEDGNLKSGLLSKIRRRLSGPPKNERPSVLVEYERDTEFGSNRRAEIRLKIAVYLSEQRKVVRDAVFRTSVYAVAGDRIDISGEGSWI